MKKAGSKLGGCLGTPMRALSRACDSACELYVRGMSGCARRVPMEAAAVGRGFGGSATAMHLRKSSDCADDLFRAASKQRRVFAAEPAGVGAVKKGLGGMATATPAAPKVGAAMGTIAEDAPCVFVADGAWASGCALKPPEPRSRGAAVGGLAARPGGFGAIKAGSEAFAR